MKFWLLTIFLGTLTYFGRTSFILIFSSWEAPDWFQKALRFVPVAAFSAIIAPSILRPEGGALELSLLNPKLLSALAAIVIAYYRRNIFLTIVIGMATLWLATWLIGS